MNNRIFDIAPQDPYPENLWKGEHKIPWNDPAFSARILGEHLSQHHHMASRKTQVISQQTQWIQDNCFQGNSSSILDLGCGPGLYATPLAEDCNHYHGIDFSPASIEYAAKEFGTSRCDFRLGDVTKAEFGGPHDVVMMLYGELNVFSPDDCRGILARAYEALIPAGRLLVEFQNPVTVRAIGESPNTWTRADEGGLFSDSPYICLTENHWYDEQAISLQSFHVAQADDKDTITYRSTTKAWSHDQMIALVREAGFEEIQFNEDWPIQDDSLILLSAHKR